jgi:methylated-DNA-[protein]-cysteine S-methyltransferase
MYLDKLDSQLGEILLAGTPDALCVLDFGDCRSRMDRLLGRHWPGVELEPKPDFGGFKERIEAYLDGDLEALITVRTDSKGTAFEEQVWSCLRTITPGAAVSYGELAVRIGRSGAARAVGRANSLNPIALVVPCHRVIGADGGLTGYAGGLERKKWLLAHEGWPRADWR